MEAGEFRSLDLQLAMGLFIFGGGFIEFFFQAPGFDVLCCVSQDDTCVYYQEIRRVSTVSLAFLRISPSLFVTSSLSLSSAVTRANNDPSIPCQFSLATAYWFCNVSICRRSCACTSLLVPAEASSTRARNASSLLSMIWCHCMPSGLILNKGW